MAAVWCKIATRKPESHLRRRRHHILSRKMLKIWAIGIFLRRMGGGRWAGDVTLLPEPHCLLWSVLQSMRCPLGLCCVFLGHYLPLWQEETLQHLPSPITPPTVVPAARCQPDPWLVPGFPQQGFAGSCRGVLAPCLGPPPSHGGMVPFHGLAVEQLSLLRACHRC